MSQVDFATRLRHHLVICAACVTGNIASSYETEGDSTPTAALHALLVKPIPFVVAKSLLVREHYLHSFPGGTTLSFGVFLNKRLLGAVTLGAGPFLAYRLAEGATPKDCLTLTRLWMSDELPSNSESKVIGVIIKSLGKATDLKFLVSYSDPAAGHVGTIYQATNWIYTGLSAPTPRYDLGDNIARHSRSLAHAYGTHSIRYLNDNGLSVKILPQSPKHRYIFFLDKKWLTRLAVPALPYPKKGKVDGN
jgi:hypothetical protein